MRTESELIISGIPHSIRKLRQIRAITDLMIASGVAECFDRRGDIIERMLVASSHRKVVDLVGYVSRERVERWVDRGIDAANKTHGNGRKINREVFYRRRELCHQCNYHTTGCKDKGSADGCTLLAKPCGVELLWMSDNEDWCPAGKRESVDMHDHRYFNDDPSSFLSIELPPDDIAEPSSELAIITHATGEAYERCREISRPAMASYAKRIGADLVELSGDLFPQWRIANKFRAAAVAKRYRRSLWLDVDVVVSDSAPSVFEETPADEFGIYDEMLCSALQSVPGWETKQTNLVCASQDIPSVELKWSGNGGILMIPQQFASIYDPPAKPTPSHWCAEQQLLTARLHSESVPVHLLDWKWNCLRTGRYWHRRREANFVHFNGVFGKQLVNEMERYVAGEL